MTTTTFDLEVVTSRTPHDFISALFDRIDVQATITPLGDDLTEIRTTNFEISTFDGAQDAISQELGIHPTVFMEFRPRPNLETDIIAVKHLLEAIDKWLHVIGNDFVLNHNGETMMMYRKDGTLYLNDASRGWTPARQSLISYPYQTITMPAVRDAAKDDPQG